MGRVRLKLQYEDGEVYTSRRLLEAGDHVHQIIRDIDFIVPKSPMTLTVIYDEQPLHFFNVSATAIANAANSLTLRNEHCTVHFRVQDSILMLPIVTFNQL